MLYVTGITESNRLPITSPTAFIAYVAASAAHRHHVARRSRQVSGARRMRHYTDVEERRIRPQGMVSQWARQRLIDGPQAARLLNGLRVELRRTNSFLRIGLAVFTAVVVPASVLLPFSAFNLSSRAGFTPP